MKLVANLVFAPICGTITGYLFGNAPIEFGLVATVIILSAWSIMAHCSPRKDS